MLFNYLSFILKSVRAAGTTPKVNVTSFRGPAFANKPSWLSWDSILQENFFGFGATHKGSVWAVSEHRHGGGARTETFSLCWMPWSRACGQGWVEPSSSWCDGEARGVGRQKETQLKSSVIDSTCPLGSREVRECVTVCFSFSSPPFLFFFHQMQISRCVFTA